MKMNTQDYLFMQFGKLIVSLMEVCKQYFPHLRPSQISRMAKEQGFPFPCFRLVDSQKSPYFVHIKDLAIALDSASLAHKNEHSKIWGK